ncbi:tRNA nucleotidyltransferase/poly(A) polymerase [Rivularia sp. PCC 7116]|uniref:CCA tRNA nucleotidyltransferase n=1 Tax=Rivularia sp. PCC 7116 TaxID=373994 RepID=UPI00029F3CC9|nr:CCA tRNA nucleotidyltransferase [Rivularia sp. PCC 7116]AFY56571.1 tRNA nucleotidyltransferase/poly(A) polymerase [Rivularia sp. PCC 7116]
MYGSILSKFTPDSLPFNLELLPQPAYLVGGAVRDALLERSRDYLDLDFILPAEAVNVARKIAKYHQAGFVLLDEQRQIARVVFADATVDIAQQEGDSVEADLHRRDFTINAIAYNIHTQEIIDPLQGGADLEKGVLRMISPANLEDDPLRLMRGYRQAAQLGFTIEAETHSTIRALASHLEKVAAERIRVELGYMLANPQGTPWLIKAYEDGLLKSSFEYATSQSCAIVAEVDKVALQLTEDFPTLKGILQKNIRDTVKTTWLGIAKLACLVNSKPEIAEAELEKLTYSKAEIQSVTTALRTFPKLDAQLSLREQYFLFREAGSVFPTTAILATAYGNVVRDMSEDKPLITYASLLSRYLTPDDPVAHPTQLLSGTHIISSLNIPSSPLIGKLLTEIAVAQVEGKISTSYEAIEFARNFIQENG